jgi:hypothetical protein
MRAPRETRIRGVRTWNKTGDAVRKRIFCQYLDEGLSPKEIIALNRKTAAPQKTCIYKMIREFEACGEWSVLAYRAWQAEQNGAAPIPNSSDARVLDAALLARARRCDAMPATHVSALGDILEHEPELFFDELQTKLLKEEGIFAGMESIARAIHTPEHEGGLGLSQKVLERKASQRCFRERMAYLKRIRGGLIKPHHVVCIDETHKSRQVLPRPSAWCPPQPCAKTCPALLCAGTDVPVS